MGEDAALAPSETKEQIEGSESEAATDPLTGTDDQTEDRTSDGESTEDADEDEE